MSSKKLTAEMEKLQHESFNYFVHETDPANGLVIDKTKVDWPVSIAATGLALASYPVAVIARHGVGPVPECVPNRTVSHDEVR